VLKEDKLTGNGENYVRRGIEEVLVTVAVLSLEEIMC
jgi:hypothetical protein